MLVCVCVCVLCVCVCVCVCHSTESGQIPHKDIYKMISVNYSLQIIFGRVRYIQIINKNKSHTSALVHFLFQLEICSSAR